MSTLPQVTWTGGLVAEPELRFTPSGKAVAEIRLAGKKSVRGANGQWEDGDPIYLNVVAWESLAENAAETLTRPGQRVTVTGRLEQQWWEKDGEKKSKFVIVADDLAVSLRFASFTEQQKAKVDGGAKSAPADDPWGSPPQDDRPPF